MNIRIAALIAALFLAPAITPSQQPSLKYVKKIGVGWAPGKWAWMSYVAFSPDGTKIASDAATAPDDVTGDLTIWSFPEGNLIRKVPEASFELSPDWKYFATQKGVAEVDTGKSIISIGGKAYPVLVFSPDSRYVAESISSKHALDGAIHIVELASRMQVSAFGKRNPYSLAISPDGVTLASGYRDTVVLWNRFTGERIAVFHGFGRYVESLAFSKDGKLLAAGNDTGGLQIWDVPHQTRLHSLNPAGGYQHVSTPAFSPDGRLVAVGIYGTGTAFLIDVATGKTLDKKKISDIGCGSVAFSPDGRFLIAPSTGGLVKWPYDTGGTVRVFEVRQH
jgi:DNA-binding beta-propeller fold protein YncE